MAKELQLGLMERNIRDNGLKIRLKVLVQWNGKMEEDTKGNGWTIR